MIVNLEMQKLLDELSVLEREEMTQLFNLAANDLGNELISFYYRCPELKTRGIIQEFLTLAGPVWLRKLLTKDTSPVVSSRGTFASLDDYLDLLSNSSESSSVVYEN